MSDLDILLTNARVVTMAGPDDADATARMGVIDDGIMGILDGAIAVVGARAELTSPRAERTYDCGGRVVMPGLVDPHTHLVFAGSRVDEFARRMAGEDYKAIAAAGGGIKATVKWSREASDEELYALTAARARAMRRHGVTSIEIKSGYGLALEHELRHLAVARRLEENGLVRVTTSLLGAHAVPPERIDDRAGYLDEVTAQMIPEAARLGLADACDVYLDEGAFSVEEARRVLTAARAAGLKIRAHVGQFRDLGGAELAAELGALSADHLEAVSEEGLRQMAAAGVVAVLLPGAWRTLRQTPPDAERMRAHGVSVAVATDCNPGTSPTVDLPLMASLAVRDAGLSLEEALVAITVNAARAAGLAGGQLVAGARADLAVFDLEDPRALAYAIGGPGARLVMLGGEPVVGSLDGSLEGSPHDGPPSEPSLW